MGRIVREVFDGVEWKGVGAPGPDPEPEVPTRSAIRHPYSSTTAPFNVPFATTATFEGNTGRTARLRLITGGAVNSDYWSVQVAQATTSDPVVRLYNPNNNVDWNLGFTIRIPTTFVPPTAHPGYTGKPDGNSVLIMPDGRNGFDAYRLTKVNNTTWHSTSVDVQDFHGSGIVRGVRAANLGLFNGLITAEQVTDALAGRRTIYNQAIAFSVPKEYLKIEPDSSDGQVVNGWDTCPEPDVFRALCVWPANTQDNQCNVPYGTNANNVAMGSWWGIPTSTNIESLITSLGFGSKPAGAAFLRTLYYRGAVVTDQSASRACYVQPGSNSTGVTQIKEAWTACINYLCRVTNVTASTPGGGAMLTDGSNRLIPLAAPVG